MSKNIVTISCARSEFEGSSFALWRRLWFHRLQKESTMLGDVSIHQIVLPVSAHQLSLLGERTGHLLFRRVREAIPEPSIRLLHPALHKFADYRALETTVDETVLSRLFAEFLPETLLVMIRQWGLYLDGKSACIVSDQSDFLAICQALVPYVRSIDVITDSVPPYREQDYVWETWGIPVCFRQEIPEDTSLVILADSGAEYPSIPPSAMVLDLGGTHSIGIGPDAVFFRFPGSFSHLATALDGISLPSLSLILSAVYPDSMDAKSAKNAGFSISRIRRPKENFVVDFSM